MSKKKSSNESFKFHVKKSIDLIFDQGQRNSKIHSKTIEKFQLETKIFNFFRKCAKVEIRRKSRSHSKELRLSFFV